jgi:hypothetical protein
MCVCTDAFFDGPSVRPGVFCFGLGLETCLQEVIAIRLPTDTTVYFVYLFPLFLPYMFRALISPSSGVSQAVFLYVQPFGSCNVYVAHLLVPVDWFVVMVSLYWLSRQTSPQAHAEEQHKHCMNQMVVYIKKQLETPLMMGLWEPETCRVKKKINTQNKDLHPLVTLLQYSTSSWHSYSKLLELLKLIIRPTEHTVGSFSLSIDKDTLPHPGTESRIPQSMCVQCFALRPL